MPDNPSMTYIARCRCGCGGIIIAVVDGRDRFTAKEVADGMRRGYSFDRLPTAEVREMPFGCRVEQARRLAGKATAQLSLIGGPDDAS